MSFLPDLGDVGEAFGNALGSIGSSVFGGSSPVEAVGEAIGSQFGLGQSGEGEGPSIGQVIAEFFQRAGLLLIGGIIVLVALWSIFNSGGGKAASS
jgi:hypothetical protein